MEQDVDIQRISRVQGKRCGHNYLYFDREGQGCCFSELGAAECQDDYLLKENEIKGIPHVVVNERFGLYTLSALRIAKANGARTYLNGMVDTAEPELLKEFLKLTDIIFINRSEYARLLEKTENSDLFGDYQIEKIFVTDGKRGCRILKKTGEQKEKAVLTENVKDTTGAGDSFAAGVITGLIKGFDDITSVRIGSTVSSMVIREWGCQTNAPTWETMKQEYLKNFSDKEEIL
jgi:sugar/nucleoside kinase (ribokinase family)